MAKPSASKTRSSFTTRTGKRGLTGILGGTFDPIHRGHLQAADELRDAAGLEAVWLMPNATPPHRPPPVASPADRLEMVRRAIVGHARLSVCDLEIQRDGVSYTVDTADELARRFPQLRFAWLIGSDEARSIRTWHQADRLLHAIDFVVFTRPGIALTMDELRRLGFPSPGVQLVTIRTPAIAAQEIRDAIRHGQSVDQLLPAAVRSYIEERGLYR